MSRRELSDLVEEILDLSPVPGPEPGEIRLTPGLPVVDPSTGSTSVIRCPHPSGGWRLINGQRLHGASLRAYRVDPRQPLGFAWLAAHALRRSPRDAWTDEGARRARYVIEVIAFGVRDADLEHLRDVLRGAAESPCERA